MMGESTATQSGVAVQIAGVRREFEGGVVAIDLLDLRVAPGEFIAILGPSGCGKSTLLRLIAGLDRPDAGSIGLSRIDPIDATSADVGGSAIAFVFQDAHLLPWRNVRRNVELPLELAGIERAKRETIALDALRRVGLAEAETRYPAQLSGGMRMRVSLARALTTRPKLLLLDEPFAALDEITRQDLDDQLRALWRASGMTVIFVTHSVSEAVYLAQRAIVFTPRPARIVIDRRIELPADRNAMIRGDATFARESAALLAALHSPQREVRA
jgi:NitT/TauT family transport system ATP-binding protein